MPLANSLVGIPVGTDVYLGVKMSDGSRRVVSYDGTYPLCTLVADGDDGFNVNCVASPGVREEQPDVVPFRFSNTAANAPAGYETLSAELVFTSYVYDPDEALASWSAKMNVSGVQQIATIQNGDPNIVASGEAIAVEGDVQIFGDSNCLTYWNGAEKGTLYARVNVPWGFDEGWYIDLLLDCTAPSAEHQDAPYMIVYNNDWYSGDDRVQPYTAGAIVPLVNNSPYDVDNPVCIITKP